MHNYLIIVFKKEGLFDTNSHQAIDLVVMLYHQLPDRHLVVINVFPSSCITLLTSFCSIDSCLAHNCIHTPRSPAV